MELQQKEEKRMQRERGRGLALLFFLLILLFFVALFSGNFTKSKDVELRECAHVMFDNRNRIVFRPCGVSPHFLSLADKEEISPFLFAKMDINRASFEKLITIRGVGKKTARQICLLRQKKKLTSKDDLLLLDGIGKKKAKYLEQFFLFANNGKSKKRGL